MQTHFEGHNKRKTNKNVTDWMMMFVVNRKLLVVGVLPDRRYSFKPLATPTADDQ